MNTKEPTRLTKERKKVTIKYKDGNVRWFWINKSDLKVKVRGFDTFLKGEKTHGYAFEPFAEDEKREFKFLYCNLKWTGMNGVYIVAQYYKDSTRQPTFDILAPNMVTDIIIE